MCIRDRHNILGKSAWKYSVFGILTCLSILTYFSTINILIRHSAKRQAFAQIQKFNFEKSYALISMLWCLKYIYIWLTPFGPLYGGPGDPQVPKMAKPGTLYLYQIRWKSLRILCLLMPKSQNFRAILCNWENWEIFANFDSTN